MAKKKKQTIGYKYFASGHFVLCHGPIDAITKISFQDKDAYLNEENANKTIYINKPSLFGGDEQQGGIQGNIELLFGHDNQQKSSTLQRICARISNAFGGLISAYRGVCSVVFDNVYIGTAPNMPDSKWRVKRIHTRHDGQQQWYDEKAEINANTMGEHNLKKIYWAIDFSDGLTEFDFLRVKQEVALGLDTLEILVRNGANINLFVYFLGCRDGFSGKHFIFDRLKTSDVEEIRDYIASAQRVNMLQTTTVLYYTTGFFSTLGTENIIVLCVANAFDGNQQLANDYANQNQEILRRVTCKTIGFGALPELISVLDNTRTIPSTLSGGAISTAMYLGITNKVGWISSNADINPAHIIRECLTNPVWGIGVSESSIDDVSFKKASDTLYAEQMGMSIKWTDSTSINEFIDNVKEHINAQLYLDRVTNKWKLYLIRDDYDADDLISLNESNIKNLDFERRTLAECVNSVTVTYWDRERAKDSTVTVQDIARIAQQGGVISQSVDYKGFTNSDLASRIALRDLKTLSSTLASVSFDVDESFSESWHEGMPFKLSDESYGLSEAVMRIRTIKRGDGINNTVYVEAIEDSFGSPMQSVVEYVPPIASGDSTAKNATAIAFEVPYIELVEQYGQDEVDAKLSNYPDLGYVGMAAIRPNNQHVNASLYVDAGAGYDERTALDFCPSASLKNNIRYIDSSFELENVDEFELLEANHRIQVNDEIMAFVSFDAVTSVITVKRGCFDTVPQLHTAGSKVFGWDNYSGIDGIEYLSGENVSLKAVTLTGSDQLSLSEANAHPINVSARAIRPYPPANVKINNTYYPDAFVVSNDILLNWVDRNRVQQTGGEILGFYDSGVIRENGVTYSIELSSEGVVLHSANNIDLSTYTIASSVLIQNKAHKLKLWSERDGYASYQVFEHSFFIESVSLVLTATASKNKVVGSTVPVANISVNIDESLKANMKFDGSSVSGKAPAGSIITIEVEE